MIRILGILSVLLLCESCIAKKEKLNPTNESLLTVDSTDSNLAADTAIIKSHLTALTKTKSFRNHKDIVQLDETAHYIKTNFSRYSNQVSIQEFSVAGQVYKNVIASFGPADAAYIVVGAHYDVYGPYPGADDNASGVTGILELARLLSGKKLRHRIELVAFSLEEPPYFRTGSMGSFVHAKSLSDQNAKVFGMVSLEMIGYFSDESGSQDYPEGVPPGMFGDKGDYIALVTKKGGREFQSKFCAAFESAGTIKSNQYQGPPSMPGIDFSDHLNYWSFDFDAMMITDTSFYRNKNYHKAADTMDTLDLYRMGKVIDGVYQALIMI